MSINVMMCKNDLCTVECKVSAENYKTFNDEHVKV